MEWQTDGHNQLLNLRICMQCSNLGGHKELLRINLWNFLHTHLTHACTTHTHTLTPHTHTSLRMWWRSGHCARCPGSTWNLSSARRISCSCCQLKASGSLPDHGPHLEEDHGICPAGSQGKQHKVGFFFYFKYSHTYQFNTKYFPHLATNLLPFSNTKHSYTTH